MRMEDSVAVWIHKAARIHGGAFSTNGDRILRIRENDLAWMAFPSSELNDCLPLPAPVAGYLTGPNIKLGDEDSVYF